VSALRELWKGGWVEFHGEYYDVPALTMEPHPPDPVPIYLGGHSDVALRRAARLGDGWVGSAYAWDELAEVVGRLKKFLAEAGRADDDDFEIIAAINAMPDAKLYQRAERELGVTGTMCMPWILDRDIAHMRSEGVNVPVDAYRQSINHFAADIVEPCA
jgi:alkanesulfonate monooxygenase SsuD/methylene tetrahydromethanopterin reductase-like flavin-dependent oxidoreductase (luciferase family)